ncbi:SRPBCC family protein [Mesorhizobium sp. Z1-4]|uniref:SRPBCC family protein n=1 Tax=Mesorhizobium sp. Z1-4 TaxID=2448478 RepID=UPI000FDB3AC2|nr:SRPBCC family protein [Mesorhizobium sp. Z1-4]
MTDHANDLVLERLIDAPREKVFRCFSDPKLLEQWFAPKPWSIKDVDIDLRPGGASKFTMHGPEGEAFPVSGVYLEVVPNEKIVTTDAYSAGWVPSENPFFTAVMTFEDAGNGKTKYKAVARHWRAEDKATHEQMGFHEGWGQTAAQLEELAKTL